jgi:hypothetical protein
VIESDGRFTLMVDNNSGTYAPSQEGLKLVKAVFEANFPGLAIGTCHWADEELKQYKAAVLVCGEGGGRGRGQGGGRAGKREEGGGKRARRQGLAIGTRYWADEELKQYKAAVLVWEGGGGGRRGREEEE